MTTPNLQLEHTRQAIQSCLNSNQLDQAKKLCQQLCADSALDADAWLLLAAIQARLGALAEVVNCCKKALALQPDNVGAHYNLGVARQTQGQLGPAESCYREVLGLAPDNPSALFNLGNVLRAQGQVSAALTMFESAVQNQTGFVDARYSMGLCYVDLGDYANAAAAFQTVIDSNPAFVDAHCSLGLCLRNLGRTREAITALQTAAATNPRNAKLYYVLGDLLRDDTQIDAAYASYQRAIAIQPSYFEAYNNLGSMLHFAGRLSEAEECFRAALRIQPQSAQIHYNMGTVLYKLNKRSEALVHCMEAVRAGPDAMVFRQQFVQFVSGSKLLPTDAAFLAEVLRSFHAPGVNYQYLASATSQLLEQDPAYRSLHERYARFGQSGVDEYVKNRGFLPLARNKLLLAFLTQTVTCRANTEHLLTALRRAFLWLVSERWYGLDKEETDFLGALACHCTNNEFAFAVDAEECELVAGLAFFVDTVLAGSASCVEQLSAQVAALAMYRSLQTLSHWEQLVSCDLSYWSPNIRLLIDRQLRNWTTEQGLRGQIKSLTPVRDAVSNKVREQYEASPYPRWLGVNLLNPTPYTQVLRELFPHFDAPRFPETTIDVLVAGCGTGKHAILSKTRFANSTHLAVDLSLASLAYAQRKTTEYGLERLQFAQADILELGNCGRRFHIIESVGVLHHLAEPSAGLKVLAGLLHPLGLMNIGLYSTRARENVTAARTAIQAKPAAVSDELIRQTRADIFAMAPDNPIRQMLAIEDFYSLSECRDLLFHVQEHCFTLPQVATLLKEHGLRFIGFECAEPSVKADYRRSYPQDTNMDDLYRWDLFEQSRTDTFLGMYVFWCQKI